MPICVFEAATEEHLNLAVACHHDWYVQAGYIDPNPAGKYIDEWSKNSKYLLVTESINGHNATKNDVVGMVRLILSPPFPIHLHFDLWPQESAEINQIPVENQCEISALSWAPKHGTKALPYLYRAIRQGAIKWHKTLLFACLDTNIIPIFKRQRLSVHICGDKKFYMGSDTIPLIMKTSEMLDSLSEKNPKLLEIVEQELDIVLSKRSGRPIQ